MTKALAPYLAGVGNLQFPLDQPIPYDLIERIVMLRASQDAEKAKANADARAKKSNSGSGPKE